jgi:hypothetical protein
MLRNIHFSNDNGSFSFHIDFFPTSQEFYHDFMAIQILQSSSRLSIGCAISFFGNMSVVDTC